MNAFIDLLDLKESEWKNHKLTMIYSLYANIEQMRN